MWGRRSKLGTRACSAWALAAVGMALAAGDSRAADESSSPQINAAHDGYQRLQPTQAPERLWTKTLGLENSTALIADGMVVVLGRGADTGEAYTLSAFDSQTGELVWSRLVQASFWAHASYADGRVYVNTLFGQLQAIDIETGIVDWTGLYGRLENPGVPSDGRLYFSRGASGDSVTAVDAATGDVIRHYAASSGSGGTAPALGEQALYTSGQCGGSMGVALDGGDVLWENDRNPTYSCSQGLLPVLSGGRLFVREPGSDPENAILDTESGEIVRTMASETPPAVAGETMVGVQDGDVVAEDVVTGERHWKLETGADPVRAAPIIVGDKVAVASASGRLAWLELGDGSVVKRMSTGGPVDSIEAGSVGIGGGGLSAGEGVLAVASKGRISVFAVGEIEQRERASVPWSEERPQAAPTEGSVAYRANAAHDGALDDVRMPARLREAWTVKLGKTIGYPLTVGDRVFALAARRHGGLRVLALRRSDGRTIWSRDLDYEARYYGEQQPGLAYDDGHVIVGADGIHAFHADDGRNAWKTVVGSSIDEPPVAIDGAVYASVNHSSVRRFDLETGYPEWNAPVYQGAEASPAVVGDRVIVTYACNSGYAFDRETGEVVWNNRPYCTTGERGKTTAVRGGLTYGHDNDILRSSDGSYEGSYAGRGVPALSGNRVISVAGSTLFASDRDTGRLVWRYRGPGGTLADPLIVGDKVFVTDKDSTLSALRLSDGRVLWSGPLDAQAEVSDPLYSEIQAGMAATRNTLAVPLVGGRLSLFVPQR